MKRRWIIFLQVVFFGAGIFLLGSVLFGWWSAYSHQKAAEQRLKALLTLDEKPIATAEEPLHFPARLEIPRIDMKVMVGQGADPALLELGAGWIPGTARPGETGNIGIAAHRDSFFRPLKDVRKDDVIRLTTPHHKQEYRIEWTRIVNPTDVEVLDPTDEEALTLVTCYPFYFVGSAPKRFIVRARAF